MATATERFSIQPRGPYRLAATTAFLDSFQPAGVAAADEPVLRLAFVVDGTEDVAAVDIRQAEGDGPVDIGVTTAAPIEAVSRQVARLLSLDHDGTGYPEIGQRDPVIGELQAATPGFRPTGFWSPFEAAVWAITSHRIQMAQAAKVKAEIARRYGMVVHHDGHELTAFPSPSVLAEADLTSISGLGGRKPEWLHGLAIAAADGTLDADRLRAMPANEALAALQRLVGVGPFSAELILIRGVMTVDVPPANEGRFVGALAVAYGLSAPIDPAAVARITSGWAPYRTWVSVLIRSAAEEGPRPRR